MKNLSLILNVLLFIAVAVLYWDRFSDQNIEQEKEIEEVVEVDTSIKEESTIKIGYINIDSLQAKYALYDELIKKLKAKQSRYEREITAKTKSFEEKVIEFQKNASTMSQFEGQTKQQELAEEEQKLYKLREDFSVRFQNEELKLNNEFQKTIKDYIFKLNETSGYDLILGASQLGSMVLDYNKDIDITKELVEGLNKEYHQKKESK